jgi:hypothetical protein
MQQEEASASRKLRIPRNSKHESATDPRQRETLHWKLGFEALTSTGPISRCHTCQRDPKRDALFTLQPHYKFWPLSRSYCALPRVDPVKIS